VRPVANGYAMVAAVGAIAVFALFALQMVHHTRSDIEALRAHIDQAQMAAAADAGIAIALSGLLADDRTSRWSIDGRTRSVEFEDAVLRIRVEDERGKVPLTRLDEEFVAAMTTYLALDDERARVVGDSLLDWVDDDDEPRPFGAETGHYRRFGVRPRNGPPLSIDELVLIRGFDRALVERLRPFVTVDFGGGDMFDAQQAHPAAIAIMQGGGIATPASISRQRELAGQRTAVELAAPTNLAGRALAISVEAYRAGARAERRVVVELTGSLARPYVVRSYD
jgi:general secretion pathway protein K